MSESPEPISDVRDPVCGKKVDPLRARAVGIFGGVTQYFCSPECKARYVDPRRADPDAPPPKVERRLAEPRSEGSGDGSSDWFAARSAAPPVPESFSDLDAGDRGAVPERQQPLSPSLIIQVRATQGSRAWMWIVPIVLLVLLVAFFGLR